MKSDTGAKFDKGRIDRILLLVSELSDRELAQLIQEVNSIKTKRDEKTSRDNQETIQL